MTPRVVDNDRDEITVTLDGKEIRGWSYADDAERRVKMLAAREFVEGWFVANARAVNSLPALVKALEDITNVSAGGPYLSATDAFEGALQALYRCRDIARAALASHKTGG